ncbi:MAG TPA: flavin reductase family protein [Longimicrobiaceae bacterium]|nr:flavin reductase family protein [Longimicrobiaceae bacterium]
MIDPSEFRRVMGHFASGLAVVTTARPDGTPCGLTASAVCSVSLQPTLLLVCVERTSDTHACIERCGSFAINVLPEGKGETLARRFAAWEVGDKFQGVAFRKEHTGAPVLDGALAWLDCRVHGECAGGDHTVFVGEVLAAGSGEGVPLVYYRGGYGGFAP